ncbi:Lrp/AsnC ligand binding domain-containing protein [Candidatus Bathyarchaeota archaeon]|nr:Lrp/AsnC ligand binding domain-containing protein [Candidatus Bathyarchaeota archaeon]
MDKALVLLTLEPGVGSEVLKRLKKIKGVLEAHFLYGPYDAYVMIEGTNTSILHDIVIERIRHVEGINTTMTCFVAD